MHLQTIIGLEPVIHLCCPYVLRLVGQRIGTGRGYRRCCLSAFHQLMAGIDSQCMTQEHMIIHLGTHAIGFPVILGIDVHTVVDTNHQILLVDHLPVFYAVTEGLVADTGITLEGEGTVSALPTVVFFYQRIGQVEMIQGHKGLNSLLDQIVNHLIVEIDALLVDFSVTVGNNAGPGQGKAIGLHSHLLHQVDVFLPMMIKIAGHLAVRLLVGTFEGIVIGYGHTLAVFIPAALDLKSRGGSTPEKIFRKMIHDKTLLLTKKPGRSIRLPPGGCIGTKVTIISQL